MTTALKIERRPLGDSRLTIPRIALGCGNFGGVGSAPELFGQGLSEAQAFELMDAAWELGIDHFDTADAYGGGRSERAIGRWIASRGVTPLLTTKTFNPMDAGADQGLAPERIERQLQSSLKRLGVEIVDLYLAHDFDPRVPIGETIGALESARTARAIRAYGVSNFNAGQLQEALASRLTPSHPERALAARSRGRARAAAAVRRAPSRLPGLQPAGRGLADGQIPPRRGLAGGIADDPAPRTVRASWSTTARSTPSTGCETLAANRGSSMAAVALAWLLADERVTQIVVGPGRPAHLEPVRDALAHPLSEAERAELESVFPC